MLTTHGVDIGLILSFVLKLWVEVKEYIIAFKPLLNEVKDIFLVIFSNSLELFMHQQRVGGGGGVHGRLGIIRWFLGSFELSCYFIHD